MSGAPGSDAVPAPTSEPATGGHRPNRRVLRAGETRAPPPDAVAATDPSTDGRSESSYRRRLGVEDSPPAEPSSGRAPPNMELTEANVTEVWSRAVEPDWREWRRNLPGSLPTSVCQKRTGFRSRSRPGSVVQQDDLRATRQPGGVSRSRTRVAWSGSRVRVSFAVEDGPDGMPAREDSPPAQVVSRHTNVLMEITKHPMIRRAGESSSARRRPKSSTHPTALSVNQLE